MKNDIFERYEGFSDAVVLDVSYKPLIGNFPKIGYSEVVLKCTNADLGFKWEVVKLKFIDVLKFKFIEDEDSTSIVISKALILRSDDYTLIDFDPIIYVRELRVNNDSCFLIKCRSIEYEVMNEAL